MHIHPPLPQSLHGWLNYISHQHRAEIVMGLERVRAVWESMGRPQSPINIMVGGTNGKGSTCAMLESILGIAGYKTGLYTSPHLVHFNERRVSLGKPVLFRGGENLRRDASPVVSAAVDGSMRQRVQVMPTCVQAEHVSKTSTPFSKGEPMGVFPAVQEFGTSVWSLVSGPTSLCGRKPSRSTGATSHGLLSE